MKNKIFVIVIILIGFSSTIFSQNLFRSGIFLHRSTGGNIWGPNGSNTSVPNEMRLYNVAHNYTEVDSITMGETSFPIGGNSGNAWWEWHKIFDNEDPDDNIYPYLENNKIIVIKSCYPSSDMAQGWGLPADTIYYDWKSVEVYKWNWRSIIRIMEQHPENFFVIWTNAPQTEANSQPLWSFYSHLFCTWAKDTLAAGLDATYGTFPPNVYVFDFFHKLVNENYFLNPAYAVSTTDSHPNAAATELVAPQFAQEIFDAAIDYESIVSVEVDFNPITNFILEQNYPNPFNPSTEINFTLAKSGNVTLKVYDSLGSEVATLVDGFMNSGKHSVKFNAKDSTSGIYFYRLKADNFTSTRKMLFIK